MYVGIRLSELEALSAGTPPGTKPKLLAPFRLRGLL